MEYIPNISIITLTKNDVEGFICSANSLLEQNYFDLMEWIIIDGSDFNIFKINQKYIELKFTKSYKKTFLNLKIKHIFANKKNVKGIYKSMNYGIKIASGKSIIFMNGGDEFFDKSSIRLLSNPLFENNFLSTVCFGQAKIISEIGIDWLFPGKKLKNIYNWLKFFEPNHQAMLISIDIAKKTKFIESCKISADKFWKKEVIRKASKLNYIEKPVCKFKLNGSSSKRPTFKVLSEQIIDKQISILRKLIILLKFLIIPFFYKYFPFIQKSKSFVIDLFF